MPSSDAPANVTPAEAFEIGYSFAMDLRGQTLEDSRAVGRLLHGYGMEAIADRIDEILRRDGFDSFKDADHGICQAKRIIRIALGADEPPMHDNGEPTT